MYVPYARPTLLTSLPLWTSMLRSIRTASLPCAFFLRLATLTLLHILPMWMPTCFPEDTIAPLSDFHHWLPEPCTHMQEMSISWGAYLPLQILPRSIKSRSSALLLHHTGFAFLIGHYLTQPTFLCFWVRVCLCCSRWSLTQTQEPSDPGQEAGTSLPKAPRPLLTEVSPFWPFFL